MKSKAKVFVITEQLQDDKAPVILAVAGGMDKAKEFKRKRIKKLKEEMGQDAVGIIWDDKICFHLVEFFYEM